MKALALMTKGEIMEIMLVYNYAKEKWGRRGDEI